MKHKFEWIAHYVALARYVVRHKRQLAIPAKNYRLTSTKHLPTVLLLAFFSLGARADISINIWEVGDSVAASVTGSLDTDVLVFDNGKPGISASVSPTEGTVLFGDGSTAQIYQSGENNWNALGPGGFASFDSASGSLFGLLSGGYIALAPDYVSGAPLYAVIVKNGSSLSELGFERADYSYVLEGQGKSETIRVRIGRRGGNTVKVQLVQIGDDVQATISGRFVVDNSAAGATVELDQGIRFIGPPDDLFTELAVQLGSGAVTLYDSSAEFTIKFPNDSEPQPWLLDLDENEGDGFLLQIEWRSSPQIFNLGLPPGYRSGDLLQATGIARNTSLAENGITPDSYEFSTSGNAIEVVARVDDAPFRVSLEEPVDGQPLSGIGNLRGFAFAADTIEKVEIYIDGNYAFDAPYGGSRADVGAAFPDVDGSDNSGFSIAFGYGNLSPGMHTITARAINAEGVYQEDSATFEVLAFDEQFVFSNQPVDLGERAVHADGDEISLEDVEIAGERYDIRLKWRTATQGFEIIEIR